MNGLVPSINNLSCSELWIIKNNFNYIHVQPTIKVFFLNKIKFDKVWNIDERTQPKNKFWWVYTITYLLILHFQGKCTSVWVKLAAFLNNALWSNQSIDISAPILPLLIATCDLYNMRHLNFMRKPQLESHLQLLLLFLFTFYNI